MFGIFKSKSVLSKQDTEFQIATFKWLLRNFGGDDFYQHATLVLPTKEYFPSKVETPEQAATETFLAVKKYAGMENWPCRLKAQEKDVDIKVAPTLTIQNTPQDPLGTFEIKEDDEVIITYNPTVAHNPMQLVATLAHELAHYLTATSPEEPPGGWDNWEFVTDIAATFLGFGIFMANAAFTFQQFTSVDSQGWRYNRSGYLSESEYIYSLAIFLKLKKIPVEKAASHLKPNLRKVLKKSINEISKLQCIEELLTVEYVPPSQNNLTQQDTPTGVSS
ncbi:hypothetical protein [Microbulbifer sp. ZKSA002]|uniref:hypothetical protein n=1 Tax=Microbulbifer sp. ZKSA002 TaxID=3243388 RepID=UPI004039FAC0